MLQEGVRCTLCKVYVTRCMGPVASLILRVARRILGVYCMRAQTFGVGWYLGSLAGPVFQDFGRPVAPDLRKQRRSEERQQTSARLDAQWPMRSWLPV